MAINQILIYSERNRLKDLFGANPYTHWGLDQVLDARMYITTSIFSLGLLRNEFYQSIRTGVTKVFSPVTKYRANTSKITQTLTIHDLCISSRESRSQSLIFSVPRPVRGMSTWSSTSNNTVCIVACEPRTRRYFLHVETLLRITLRGSQRFASLTSVKVLVPLWPSVDNCRLVTLTT